MTEAVAVPTVGQVALAVLATADPAAKVKAARAAARAWRRGLLEHRFDADMPDWPARPDRPELLPPAHMPKRGKGGSARARIAMLHALAHIEFVAIDLAFDLVGRFGAGFPCEFVDDWMRVGADEAMHFALLDRRLRQCGSHYGALPAHDGLWEAARETAHDRWRDLPSCLWCLKRVHSTSRRRLSSGSRRQAISRRRGCWGESIATRFAMSPPGRNGSTWRRSEGG